MLHRIKRILPDSTDWLKLKFEAYKITLVSILALVGAAITFAVPSARNLLTVSVSNFGNWVSSPHYIYGYFILFSGIACTYLTYHIFIVIFQFRKPSYVKSFTSKSYDNIHWRWKWAGEEVNRESLRAFCTECDTELRITFHPATVHENPRTHIYCTMCNKGFGIRNVQNIEDHARRKIESDARTGRWKQR